jgi:hypothetical protein
MDVMNIMRIKAGYRWLRIIWNGGVKTLDSITPHLIALINYYFFNSIAYY